jgi:uncharacterized protein (DUF1697 family)
MKRHIALLRGVNVGGRTKVEMAKLRALAEELGLDAPRTFIASGNLLFGSDAGRDALETMLEAAIAERFGLETAVMVRTAEEWPSYLAANPFPEAAADEPNRLMLLISKRAPDPAAAAAIGERARDGERVAWAGGALWIHYPGGAGTSRLSPSLVDRLAGSPTTARNWNSAVKIGALLAG